MLNIAQKRYYANCYNCPIMYLRYVQHGLWLKRSGGKCVWNGLLPNLIK